MKNINDILFIVQARLGSQRVPQKMIRSFGPEENNLCTICLEKIKKSIIPLNQFYFSVYEEELKEIGKKMGVQIYDRSEQSANSEGNPLSEIYEWYTLPYKYIILISACNPFLKVETINKFIEQFLSSAYNSLFSVKKEKNYFWDEDGRCINSSGQQIMNTKYVAPIFSGLHCLYASRMNIIREGQWMGNFKQNSPALFVMDDPEEMFDIDYEFDFKICNILYKYLNE